MSITASDSYYFEQEIIQKGYSKRHFGNTIPFFFVNGEPYLSLGPHCKFYCFHIFLRLIACLHRENFCCYFHSLDRCWSIHVSHGHKIFDLRMATCNQLSYPCWSHSLFVCSASRSWNAIANKHMGWYWKWAFKGS